MIKYVTGLMFDKDMDLVTLIEKKQGPEVVVGKWNGLGGKIEEGELAHEAMSREFREEADIKTTPRDWTFVCKVMTEDLSVKFFWSSMNNPMVAKTMTNERVQVWAVCGLPGNLALYLNWMIPFIQDPHIDSIIHNSILSKYLLNGHTE